MDLADLYASVPSLDGLVRFLDRGAFPVVQSDAPPLGTGSNTDRLLRSAPRRQHLMQSMDPLTYTEGSNTVSPSPLASNH
jgi:hypothetical protein